MGQIEYLPEQKSRELLDLKDRLGFDDPRFHNEDCDLCGNSAFRDGYREQIPVQRAFPTAPDYPGYLKEPGSTVSESAPAGDDMVRMITDQVLAALGR